MSRKPISKPNTIKTFLIVLLVVLLVFFISNILGLSKMFNYFPVVKEGTAFTTLFIIGLLTSVHCVAMCGGIGLTQTVDKNQLGKGKKTSIRPSLLYNLGRVISYTIIGGIAGGVGSVFALSGKLRGVVMLIAAVFMVIMGLNLLGTFPWLKRITPRMPKMFLKNVESNSPLIVGLLNGLMPCGPLQAMQIYALSTGSVLKGALSMLLFSLGTVPLLFGLGTISTMLTKKFTQKMMIISSVLVLILGVFMFQNGLALIGAKGVEIGTESFSGTKAVLNESKTLQTVTINVAPSNYGEIIVQKGIKVKFNLKAEEQNINGCNKAIQIPEFSIQKSLSPGDNIVEFLPENVGEIQYSCWMGMIRNKIIVVDDLRKVNPNQ